MSQTHLRKNFIFGFRSLARCRKNFDEWLKLHWKEFLRWINIFEFLLSTVTLLFAILNGTDSWLKLDQMTSTLTCNLVKMDNLVAYFIPLVLFVLMTSIISKGLSIEYLVLLGVSKYHRCGTFGREQLITRSHRGVLHIRLITVERCLFFLYVMCTNINQMLVNISIVSTLEQPMMLSLDSYSAYSEVAKSWDQLQVGNKCCGVHNYSDWFGLSLLGHFYDSYKLESPNGVPDSCCKQLTVGCGRNVTNLENIYPTGCLKSLGDHILKQIVEWIFKWLSGYFVVMLINIYINPGFRQEYGCNIEENVSDNDEIDIEDEGVDTDVSIRSNIRDDEGNEYNGNQGGSVGTTVIHTVDVHRDACTYSDDHTL